MFREVGCVTSLVEFQADENISGFDDEIEGVNHEEGLLDLPVELEEILSPNVRGDSEPVGSRSSDDDRSFSVWEYVDVPRSPGLTRLIGALTIEECDIPSLDLSNPKLDSDRRDRPASDAIDLPDLLTSTKGTILAPIAVSSVGYIGYYSKININFGGLKSNYSAAEH